ncbi:MAG: hypothetical protein HY350_00765 [Candidatus Omnitrophica bacterium]|nr:hypothetical protein [Candidatus Omnitrophota bacterium]
MDEIRKYLGVDSIGYLSIEGLLSAVSFPAENYCVACFTGEYPLPFGEEADKYSIEKTSHIHSTEGESGFFQEKSRGQP